MAHFAQLDETNTVTRVIVVNNAEMRLSLDVVEDNGFFTTTIVESELAGVEFCKSLYGAETNWKQTSYNGEFRGKYAGVGDTFDGTNFVAPVSTEVPTGPVLETPVEVALDPVEAEQVLVTDQIQALETDQISMLETPIAGTADSVTIDVSNNGV